MVQVIYFTFVCQNLSGVFYMTDVSILQGSRGGPGIPGMPGPKGHRVSHEITGFENATIRTRSQHN